MPDDILTNDYLECLYAVMEARYPSTVARLRRHTTACAERVETWQDRAYRYGDRADAAEGRVAELEADRDQFLIPFGDNDEHPDGYDDPCECRTCLSYGESDTP